MLHFLLLRQLIHFSLSCSPWSFGQLQKRQLARNADSFEVQSVFEKKRCKTAGGCYKPEHYGGRDHGIAIAAQAYYACTVPVHIITGGNDRGGHGNARRPSSLC